MAKKIPEQKLAEQINEAIHDVRFDYNILANILVNNNTLYAQTEIVKLLKAIVEQQDRRFHVEWEAGRTNEGLIIASHLAEVINTHTIEQ